MRTVVPVRVWPLLVSVWLTGCVGAHMNVPPPPQLPMPPGLPADPEYRSEPLDYAPDNAADAFGPERLKLAHRTLAIAPVTGVDPPEDLGHAVLRELIRAGFANVHDLEASSRVLAVQRGRTGAGDVTLGGWMADVVEVAPVAAADVVVSVELLAVTTDERTVPVRTWYEPSDIAAYEALVDAWRAQRDPMSATAQQLVTLYDGEYATAEQAYVDSRPFWQKAADSITPPPEFKAYVEWKREARRVLGAFGLDPPSVAELQDRAAAAAGVKPLRVHRAAATVRAIDARSGQLLSLLDVHAESLTADDLTDALARQIAVALEAR